jgi:putative membrane protein insertion efficiency factor
VDSTEPIFESSQVWDLLRFENDRLLSFEGGSPVASLNFALARCLFGKVLHAGRLMPSALVFFIRVYRVVFAPLKVMFGTQGCCRFTPSCSHYAEQAICAHGICRGIDLSVRRLLRCHPWGAMGPDPVPPARGRAA